ncbi:thermonuclease family protein [Nonomuraea indica]|uniref:thermonuclease family protein n=1 Tax=Nonomuraea indica TaxID=1581193 RepID=UPI0015DE4397|nr:thermonuclease family protein [Nonomuraea indica]
MRLRAAALTVAAAAVVSPTLASPAAAAPPGLPKGTVSAKIVKIVDGDTIDVRRGGKVIRVRLLEVDTPERGQCWFKTATARTASLLRLGSTTYLLRDKEPKDRYGRSLFYVFNSKGVHVNRNLVRYGYGKAALYMPNDKYIRIMRAEEAKAKREKLRIWSSRCDTGGTTPTPTPTPTPSNPSGTDPRYRTCGDANAAGYGPYYRGRDPEYAWYQDRDGDGVVCER